MSGLHGDVISLKAIVFLGDVDLVRNGCFFGVALIVDGGLGEIRLDVFEAAEMASTGAGLTNAIVRIMVIEVGSEQPASCLLEITILE